MRTMERLLLTALITMTMVTAMNAQSGCCAPTATQEFAALATGAEFRNAHAEPESADEPIGTRTKLRLADGTFTNVYTLDAEGAPTATIIVIHEWWGLNEHIMKAADQLWMDLGKSVDVIAVDLYDGVVATTRDAAAKAMQEADENRIEDILHAVINSARSTNIGTIGWCFGGGWSLRASLMAGDMAKACVMYYGMPIKDVDQLKKLNAPVLGVFASEDKWITTSVVDDFQANMMSAEKMLKVKMYAADHAFANPSNPHFDEAATTDAWENTLEFFRLHLLP